MTRKPRLLTPFFALLLLVTALFVPAARARADSPPRSTTTRHTITYDKYALKIDGRPLYLWGAEFHYFRLPSPDEWRDVLQKIRAAGFNAVSLYFDWGYHSPKPGVYDFTGVRDVDRLLSEAERAGLYVIARPGPYINAELSGGGFPSWLNTRTGVNRTSEPGYLEAARQWMSRIDAVVARHQLTHGTGTVVLYQVENEYQGGRHDADYMEDLKTWAREDGIDVPTFVNDGGANGNWVSGKGAPDLYGFDAYPQGFDCTKPDQWNDLPDYSWVKTAYAADRPLLIPEAQGGAFDPWGGTGYDGCRTLTGTDFTRVFGKMNIAAGITGQSFYMTYGGTSWGWLPDPNAVYSSYDYGSAISESRQLTDKYAEFKRLGYLVNAVAPLARTDPAAAPQPTDPALRIDRRVNPDTGTQFFVVRHADTRAKDTDETTLSLSGRDGDYPRVPQQGAVRIGGRDAKLLVAGYDLGAQRLVYSTSEIMTHARIGGRDVALLYGRAGEAGETVLRYAKRPDVKVLAGDVTATWDAARGDLRLNYTHKGLARVLVGGLELLIADDAETAAWWRQDTAAGPVLVRGPYLVRTAALDGDTLALTGDTSGAGPIEVIAPARKVTWNGRPVAVTAAAGGSLTGRLGDAPRPVRLPTLTDWKYREEAPEAAPGFDDSTWTVAGHLTANHPSLAGSPPVLAMDEYGFHHGDVWYRGRFRAGGHETALALNAATGAHGTYAVWLNGRYLGESGNGRHTFDIPAGTLKADNVVAVLVENMGHNEEWGHDYSKEPRGLLSADLLGGATTIGWRIQGNRGGEDPVDAARGPFNAGGLYGERAGWSLPGYPDGRWRSVTLPYATGPGVRWYRTTATLDLPRGQDTAVALDLGGDTGKDHRTAIYVNGWLIGRYLPGVGPQHRFVVPNGILHEHGRNTIALAVWSGDGSGPGSVKLVEDGAHAGGVPVRDVAAPSYSASRYAMPAAAGRVAVSADAFLRPGTPVSVPVTFTAARAGNVDLTLTAPDGWTVRPDGPARFAGVGAGRSVTTRFTVTPPADPVSYAVLTATADTGHGHLTGEAAVQVPPAGPTGDAYVSDLPLVRAVNGWGPVERDKSNGEDAAGDGRTLSLGGRTFAKGLGVHGPSQVRVYLGGGCTRFTATVGVDDEVGDGGSVTFQVVADGQVRYDGPVVRGSDPGTDIGVDVTGTRWLDLVVTNGGDDATQDHADWADAKVSCS
ncbi:beta-galactosidase [Actinoallomurus acanthiterrae]